MTFNIQATMKTEPSGKIVAGRNAVTDGPFSESKEAIAGFLIIQVHQQLPHLSTAELAALS